ncbi:MAG: hypothetical protein RLZZ488_2462 [Pseudomonadota bacterium]|jgi:hypothetical protein
MTKYLRISALISILCFAGTASANPGIFPGETYSDNSGGSYQVVKVEECRDAPLSFVEDWEAMSCRTQRAFRAGIEATQVTLGICALGAPLPMQAKVAFGFTVSVVAPIASFVLNHIPCDSTEDDLEIVTNMCAMLAKQGVKCDPSKVTRRKEPLP